jgi:hypothetical protein
MRKLFYSILLVMFLHPFAHAQKNIKFTMVLPKQSFLSSAQKNKVHGNLFSFNHLKLVAESETKFQSFIAALPVIKITETATKRSLSFFAALSPGDLLENAFNKVNASLLNTYDDEVPELFKDAPFMVQLKCFISL